MDGVWCAALAASILATHLFGLCWREAVAGIIIESNPRHAFWERRNSLLPGRGIVTDPKHDNPESDHPHEDDLGLEFHEEALPSGGEEHPLDAPSLNASADEFHFSGPIENLDFSEPSGFEFPTEQPLEAEVAAEGASEDFSAPEAFSLDVPAAALGPAEEELVAEAAAELEPVGETEDEAVEAEAKPKFELPAWVHTAQWVAVGVAAVASLLAVAFAKFLITDPKQVTLILNIACPLMLGLIPFALWRSSSRWSTPAASALYTVMLAIGAAALIAGTWCVSGELASYDWKVSKTEVTKSKPVMVITPMPDMSPAPAKGQ